MKRKNNNLFLNSDNDEISMLAEIKTEALEGETEIDSNKDIPVIPLRNMVMSGFWNTLQAYADPIHKLIRIPDTRINQRLVEFSDIESPLRKICPGSNKYSVCTDFHCTPLLMYRKLFEFKEIVCHIF